MQVPPTGSTVSSLRTENYCYPNFSGVHQNAYTSTNCERSSNVFGINVSLNDIDVFTRQKTDWEIKETCIVSRIIILGAVSVVTTAFHFVFDSTPF